MSSGINYNPIPPRVWSRVQDQCTTNQNNTNIENDIVYIPLTKQYVTPAQAQYQAQMLQKGNILQYKNNSANLTKNQKYSRISKGFGNLRRKCYATQNATYSNPNTSSLLRVNYTNIPYPNQIVGSPNNISGPYQPNVPNPFDCSSNLLQDGGNLVCNAIVNPCTGEIIESFKSYQLCYSSTCSDVPGRPIELCWYPGTQTWYPKQRYIMSNSLNKWPEGYKGFVSAVTPVPPVLSITVNSLLTEANLSWTINSSACLPIANYKIYQDGLLINIVSYEITSQTIQNLIPNQTYTFYVEAVNGKLNSGLSNIVSTSKALILQNTNTNTNTNNQNSLLGATDGRDEHDSDNDTDSVISEEAEKGLLSDGGFFIIETPPDNNTITLPTVVTNQNAITIYNKTSNSITINSTYTMYNSWYAPTGVKSIILQNNITGTFTYIYTKNNVGTIHVLFN
jgi:hypothetical protein